MRRPEYRDDDGEPLAAIEDDGEYPHGASVTVSDYPGIAWYVSHIQPTDDGRVVCVMVGDDRYFVFDREDLRPLAREDYCGSCGQIGCTHDGLDRDE